MSVASPIVLSFFLRPSFSRLLSTSRELFLILVLNPVGTFVEKKAQEVRFARVWIPIYSYLVQCAQLICAHIFFQRFFSKSYRRCAYDAHVIFFLSLNQTSLVAARFLLLAYCCCLFFVRYLTLASRFLYLYFAACSLVLSVAAPYSL